MRRCLCFLFLALAGLRPTESPREAVPALPQSEEPVPAPGVSFSTKEPVPSPGGSASTAPLEIHVSGRVRTHDGSAEPGCEVEAFVADESGELRKSAGKVLSDAAGRYGFTSLAAVKTRLVASAELLDASLEVELATGPTHTDIDLFLPEEWRPVVRLEDESGRLLTGKKLQLWIDMRRVALDALGECHPRLSAETHDFRAQGSVGFGRDFIQWESCQAQPFASEVSIVLREVGYAEGVVLSPEGIAIPHPRLTVVVDGSAFCTPFFTEDAGFRTMVPVGKIAALRPAQPWKSEVDGEPGRFRYFTGTLENVRADDQHLVLRTHWVDSDRTLKVRCFSPEGEPIQSFTAQAWFGDRDQRYHDRPDVAEDCDSCGVCNLTGLPDLPVTLEISLASNFPPAGWFGPEVVTVIPHGQEVQLHFRNGAVLEGRAYMPDGSFARGSTITVDSDGDFGHSATTDEEGRFTIVMDGNNMGTVTVRGTLTTSEAKYAGTLQPEPPGLGGLRMQLLPMTK